MSGPLTAEQIKLALQNGARINPSRSETFPDLWCGTAVPGSRWTAQQLARMRVDLDKALTERTRFSGAVIALLREPETLEAFSIPLTGGRVVLCPLLARSRDGKRVLIITPSGEKKWTDAN